MERARIIAAINQANRDVTRGEATLAKQRAVVDALEEEGRPTEGARELLETYQVMQKARVAERDRLQAELRHISRPSGIKRPE